MARACQSVDVALTVQRDLDAVVAGITAWLADATGPTSTSTDVQRPTEGWSSETVLVRATVDGEAIGRAIRLAPVGEGIFPTYDLGLQARAQALAAAAGVADPGPGRGGRRPPLAG